jgi:hypothetical protein
MTFGQRLAAQRATLRKLPAALGRIPAALAAMVQSLAPSVGARDASAVRAALAAANAPDALRGDAGAGAGGASAQIVVLMSTPGVLFGVDSAAGHILWRRFVGAGSRLLPLGHGAHDEVAVVSGSSALHRFYALSGAAVGAPHGATKGGEALAEGEAVLQVVPLTLSAGAAHEPVSLFAVVVDSSKTGAMAAAAATYAVRVVPSSAAAHAAFAAHAASLIIHTVDTEQGVVRGFAVAAAPGGERGKQESASWVARPLWRHRIAAPRGGVACGPGCFVAHRHIGDAVREAAPAKVKGDDSLLLKYLNPHMLALASLEDSAVEGGGTTSALRLTVLDAVSGRTLHSLTQPNAAAPVSLVWLENWLVYSFWNPLYKRTELATVALYKGAVDRSGLNPWTASPAQVVGGGGGGGVSGKAGRAISSFAPQTVIALHKRFLIPEGVTAMAATATAHSIAPKALLIATQRGQLLQLPLGFVDPRRPTGKPSPAEAKEGLVQFSAHLPTPASFVVSYNRTIERVTSVTTAPADMESSSLVMVSILLCTVTFHANLAHSLTRSP